MIAHPPSQAIRRIRKAVASVWRPRLTERLSDYSVRTVRLSPLWEAGRGAYNLDDNPFWRDILDAMTDMDVRSIAVLKSTRVGGTLALIAALIGLSDLDPGPAMVVTPDETSATEIRDRVYDTAAASKQHADKVPPKRNWNLRSIDLQSNQCFIAWAGSAQRLRGRTCRRVFFSETDVYPPAIRGGGDAIRAGEERSKRSFYSLHYYESSPDDNNSDGTSTIATKHAQGNQMTWHCPCPHCGRYQELRFFTHAKGEHAGRGGIAGYKDEHGNLLTAEDALKNAHYVCLNGCRIENHEKNEMVRRGVWCPKGCKVTKSGKVTGKPDRSRRHISVHLWTVHVPSINFGVLAEAYIKHYVTNDLKEYFQNWLGRIYKTGRKLPSWQVIGKRLSSYYRRGEVPVGVYFLTAGIDVQLDGVYWAVYGWGHLSRCWLIDWGYQRRFISNADEYADDAIDDVTFTNVASDLQQLRASVLNREYPMFGGKQSPYGKKSMRLLGAAIDGNYRNNAVHRFAQQENNSRLYVVRGDHHVKPKDRFRKGVIDKTRDGKQLDHTREVWGISTSHYKTSIYDRLLLEAGVDQSIAFPQNMQGLGQDYLRQLCNEKFEEMRDRTTNKVKHAWVEMNTKIGSHGLDTFVYGFARAEMVLATNRLTWDMNTWRNGNATTQQEQVAMRDHMTK